MINAHESGSNSGGAGTCSRDLTKNKVLAVQGFYLGFAYRKINIYLGFAYIEKSISPLFPGPRWDVVANDWCIRLVEKVNK